MDTPLRRPGRRLTIIVEGRGTAEAVDAVGRDIGLVAATVVDLARAEGLPGASVFLGDTGYGPGPAEAGGRPVMVVIVGEAECVDDFADAVTTALPDALVTVEDVVELVRPRPAGGWADGTSGARPVASATALR